MNAPRIKRRSYRLLSTRCQHATPIAFSPTTLSPTSHPLPHPPPHKRQHLRLLPILPLQTSHGAQLISARCLSLSDTHRQPLQHSRAIIPHARCRTVSHHCRSMPYCPGCLCNNTIPRRLGCHARSNPRTFSGAATLRPCTPLHRARRITRQNYPAHGVCQWPRNYDNGQRQARRTARYYCSYCP